MKTQGVLLKAMAKKITWWEAAEIIGVTERTIRRWRERMESDGYDRLADLDGNVSIRFGPHVVAAEPDSKTPICQPQRLSG